MPHPLPWEFLIRNTSPLPSSFPPVVHSAPVVVDSDEHSWTVDSDALMSYSHT